MMTEAACYLLTHLVVYPPPPSAGDDVLSISPGIQHLGGVR